MSNKPSTSVKMRVYHRYLGFFLSGIMAIYAISGMILIFRNTDFLKSEQKIERTLEANMPIAQLGKELKLRGLNIERTEGDILYFKDGNYNKATGEAVIIKKELPFILDKLTHLHKATTKDPLFFLNIFFGASLLFFVISAFWMYLPGGPVLRKGLWFAGGGILLALIMLFV